MTGAPESTAVRKPRRDVQRNRDALLGAARDEFAEQGLGAPLEHIARRAGLGIATLYRHFPTRVELVDAILTCAVKAHAEIAERALAMDDPWSGFAYYLEESCRLAAENRGVSDMMSVRLPEARCAEAAKRHAFEVIGRVIRRAQDSGQLRTDLTSTDLAFLTWANSRILDATAEVAPDAWRRHLGFLLDGFRAEAAHELAEPPLTPAQTYHAMLALGHRCTT
jgi:AcrR family transcriptional regulator